VRVDPATVVRFLRTAYEPEDWVAIFLKSYASGRVTQRVRSVAAAQREKFQAWLRAENAAGANGICCVELGRMPFSLLAPVCFVFARSG